MKSNININMELDNFNDNGELSEELDFSNENNKEEKYSINNNRYEALNRKSYTDDKFIFCKIIK